MSSSLFHVFFDNKEIPMSEIQQWESRRASYVISKLTQFIGQQAAHALLEDHKLSLDHLHDLTAQRKAIQVLKNHLGEAGIEEMLKNDIWWSDKLSVAMMTLSCGFKRQMNIEVYVEEGDAKEFVDWYNEQFDKSIAESLIGAAPDHFILKTNEDKQIELWEILGGAPMNMCSRVFFSADDTQGLTTTRDRRNFPDEFIGTARLQNGMVVGGVWHQFRNEGHGFRARLTIDFPILIFPSIQEHKYHLASEFTNWFKFYLDDRAKK